MEDSPPRQPPGLDRFFQSIRDIGIVRGNNRWIGGVASGIAQRTHTDPMLVRAGFIVLSLLAGVGLAIYGIAWALLPEESDGRIHAQEATRGNVNIALVGALFTMIIGLGNDGIMEIWGPPWIMGWLRALLWLAVVLGVLWMIRIAIGTRRTKNRAPTPPMAEPSPTTTTPEHPTATPFAAETTSTAPTLVLNENTSPPRSETMSETPMRPEPLMPPHPPVPPPHPVGPYPRPQVYGPGRTIVSIFIGLSFLSGAGLLLLDQVGTVTAHLWTLWWGLFVALMGIGLIVTGVQGRRSGILGFFAIVGILIGTPIGIVSNAGLFSMKDKDVTTVVTTVQTAREGSEIAAGSLTYDLSRVNHSDLPTDKPLRVPLELGLGELTVIVPDDVTVRANTDMGAGSVKWTVGGADEARSGLGIEETFVSEETSESPVIILDIEVGAGSITITEN